MKIVNVGSLNIDRVYRVDHFVSAGETLASDAMETFVGGKGLNQSVALAAAGAEVWHAGMVGGDGAMLTDFLAERGVDTRFVRAADGPSGHAIIQVDARGQNCILLYGGTNRCLAEAFIDEVLAGMEPEDILLLQNEINGLPYILSGAADRGLRVAFNPSPIDRALPELPLGGVTWFILNEIEGRALSGREEPTEILDSMRQRYPAGRVVLTLGKDGAVYDDGNERYRHGIYKVPVVDTTAAGDTFTGYFLACALRELPPDEALRVASVASSLAVSRKGAAPSIPAMREVLDARLTPSGE